MSKKNKNKNSNPVQQPAVQPQSVKPTIKVTTEILTTEEGVLLLNESLSKMEEYVNGEKEKAEAYVLEQKDKADAYYKEKLEEADGLRGKAESEIQKEVDKAVKQKEKEMKDQIEDAKKEAKEIVQTAKDEAKEEAEKLDERQKKIEEDELEFTKKLAELEANKVNYKKEVLDDIQEELKSISGDKEKLEEDKKFYEEELSNNTVKRSEILAYKTRITGLESDLETINKLYSDLKDREKRLNEQILLYGDDPSKAVKENADLRKKVSELESALASCPSKEELAKLRENNQKFEELNNKLELLKQEKLRLESENIEMKVDKDEIESYRKFIKILELQKSELQRELDRNIELYNNSTEKVFASLSLIDSEKCNDYPSIVRSQGISLRVLCDRFRGYLANRSNNPLYYEEKTIRTFIAGFASSRIMILEGLSGTGKSSLPRAFADFMGSHTIEVPVQSSWKDRNDLLGFYNDFKKQYKETEFLKALYRATHDTNNIYIIVLDEMNLSRIEYYFADLLSVLEKPNVEDWKIELISDYASISQNKEAWPELIKEGKLQISDNTWFVGTANKDDSTFIITDKVYDRSVVLNFDKKGEFEKVDNSTSIQMNNSDFQAMLHSSARFTNASDQSRFKEMLRYLDDTVKEYFQITFGNRIANQLEKFVPVYIACGGTVDEAIDIMFSRKVLRKLEGIYDENTKENLDLFKDDIKQRKFNMPITIKAIERMVEKI